MLRTTYRGPAQLAADIPLSAFAMVMATGITSAELRLTGQLSLAAGTLILAVASFVLLSAVTCWRAVRWPAAVWADLTTPDRAFAAFAVPAASCVLCTGLVAAGYPAVAAALVAFALAAWLALTALVPWRLAGRRPSAARVGDVNGTWFLWAVGTQSLAIGTATLAAAGILPATVASPASHALWLAGIAIYVATLGAVGYRLVRAGLGPAGARAAYWVAMGAASISVLAAALVLRIPGQPVRGPARAAFTGAALALWALATALIPMLAAATVRLWLRHRPRPLRVTSRAGVWTIAFPLVMYATASMRFGTSFGLPVVHRIGALAAGPAAAVWAAAFVGLVIVAAAAIMTVIRHRRRPPSGPGPVGRTGYKCQALIKLVPVDDDGDGGQQPPDAPVYRAVVSARHHGSGQRELFNGLVTISGDIQAPGDESILVTLVAFGREPGDCLAPGDFFTLWRGRDLARGIVTRRIFV